MSPAPINAETQLVGLIGWPIEHSVSPAMHNAAFAELGLNWRYVPLPVRPREVESAARGLAALGFLGANVTVPHKEATIRAVEQISGPDAVASDARTLGAVNTLVVKRNGDGETSIKGRNTDVAGFLGALKDGGFHPESTTAVVVGAGGAARAVVFGLLHAGAESIVVLNRSRGRAEALVSDLASTSGNAAPRALHALPLRRETLIETTRAAQLLVNATPVGMWPYVDCSIWPEEVPLPSHVTVFDLVYNPVRTKLLRLARASGANGIEGLGMLVGQGALAFAMWTGQEAPVSTMRVACSQALRG